MTERQPRLEVFRNLAEQDMTWRDDMSAKLYDNPLVDNAEIDKALLSVLGYRAPILTHGEVTRFLHEVGINPDEDTLHELSGVIDEHLPATKDQPTEINTSVSNVERMNTAVNPSRYRLFLRLGYSGVVLTERAAAKAALIEYYEMEDEYLRGVWLPDRKIMGIGFAKTKKAKTEPIIYEIHKLCRSGMIPIHLDLDEVTRRVSV